MFESSLFRMIILSLIMLLISNAITLRRDKSILYSRVVIQSLILTNILVLNNILALPTDFTIHVHTFIHLTWYHLLSYFTLYSIYIYTSYVNISRDNIRLLSKSINKLLKKSLLNYIIYVAPNTCATLSLLLPLWDIYEIKGYIMSTSELESLNEDMLSALKHMLKMTQELESIKRTDNIKYIIDSEGNMSIDIPSNMSDSKANTISKRIGIIDRVYNTQSERYKELLVKDENFNNKSFSNVFQENYQNILSRHKILLEKDN